MIRPVVTLCLGLVVVAASAGDLVIPPRSHAVLTEALSADTLLRDMKLREAGLIPGTRFPASDEIRIFKDRTVTNAAPLARIWINASQSNRYWFHTGGDGAAEDYVVKSNALVVVVTRAGTNTIVARKP